MKKTKIVATIGPSSEDEEVLSSMIDEGLNVCRLNFSHGNHEEHKKRIETIKKVRSEKKVPLAIMLDTKGPEIRIGTFKNSKIRIEQGQSFILTIKDVEGDQNKVSVSYKNIISDVEIGKRILIDDGLLEFVVQNIDEENIYMTAINSGELSDRKGVNIPDTKIKLPSLTERDIDDIKFGIKNGIDFIAASFIRTRNDVLEIRKVLEENSGHHISIISKIESREGVDNIDEILEVSDGIMVARGDLGVEIRPQEIPLVQKELIRKCNEAGKVVITATQMLDSMTRNPRPTRAEVTDVANAILDGTSAIMLSGETAAGKYPVASVRMMKEISENTEESVEYKEKLRLFSNFHKGYITDALAKATWQIAKDLSAKAIITATSSGQTSRAISKFRPNQTIIALTYSTDVMRKLYLEWGVYPILVNENSNYEELFREGIFKAKSDFINDGDIVILTAGVPMGKSGSTNLLKVEVVAKMLSKGMPIGKGKYIGRAVVANNEEELLNNFKDEDIIITIGMHKDMVKFVERASAIVTEEGGLTSSGAIIGLTLKKPTIVGASNVTKLIKTGDIITLDLESGIISKGDN